MIVAWLLLCLSAFWGLFLVEGSKEFLDHVAASGTQHGRPEDDPNFYTSNSNVPHLPRLDGFMGSHGKMEM